MHLPRTGTHNGGPRRFENVLPDALFEAVRGGALSMVRGGRGVCTYWESIKSERLSTLMAVTQVLRALVPPLGLAEGVEWWVRAKDCAVAMDLHVDKDETLAAQTGQVAHPEFASVLYLTGTGGPTLIVDQTKASSSENARQGFVSPPRANAFLVFPGHLLHGVLAQASPSDEDATALRITLLLNWWRRRPLRPGCADFDGIALGGFSGSVEVEHDVAETPLTRVTVT